MKLRIGSGKFKNRQIKSPNLAATRVSTSYSRKVIFDTLQINLEGAHVLDLFAGSGSLGIEAISRGASKATFVESEFKPFKTIKENCALLEIENCTHVTKQDVFKYVQSCRASFDMIFLDPPYSLKESDLSNLLNTLNKNLLKENGLICLEFDSSKIVKVKQEIDLLVMKERIKGETALVFFKST